MADQRRFLRAFTASVMCWALAWLVVAAVTGDAAYVTAAAVCAATGVGSGFAAAILR